MEPSKGEFIAMKNQLAQVRFWMEEWEHPNESQTRQNCAKQLRLILGDDNA